MSTGRDVAGQTGTSSRSRAYPVESLLAQEIAQQPELWPTTLDRVRAAAVTRDFTDIVVVLTGAGTSAYAAAAIAAGWPGARALASTDLLLQSPEEIEATVPGFAQRGLLISLARSGDSPESAGVVERMMREMPAVRHMAIVCNAEGRLAKLRGVEVLRLDPRTNDRSLAMTGSFSNLTLAGLALRHADELAAALPQICARVHQRLPELYAAAGEVAAGASDRFVVLTSTMHALAVEASLKVIELTAGRVLTAPETFLALRHGPVSLLRAETPVLCFASMAPGKQRYEEDLVEDLRGRGLGRITLVGGPAAKPWNAHAFVAALAPELPDTLRTPFEIVFAQLVAYRMSERVGIDPDNPSPGGTVTRVVRPFRLHPAAGN